MSQPATLSKSAATLGGTLGLAIIALLVVTVFARTAGTSVAGWGQKPADQDYNLLVEGFQAGQLSLNKAVPPGFAQLRDPYDPIANLPYRIAPSGLHDLSYYRARLFLYHGITPALLLFWPWATLTGGDITHEAAVTLFCGAGFLGGLALLSTIWRRFFPSVSGWLVAALAAGLGLATGVPILLQSSGICEVPISCAYALTMLALAAIWQALIRPNQSVRWLAAASLCYGLAVGARPSELPGAAMLLIPVWSAWSPARRRRQMSPVPPRYHPLQLLAAAVVPLTLCGLGLLAYNYLRFQNPLEFGQHYQLAADRQEPDPAQLRRGRRDSLCRRSPGPGSILWQLQPLRSRVPAALDPARRNRCPRIGAIAGGAAPRDPDRLAPPPRLFHRLQSSTTGAAHQARLPDVQPAGRAADHARERGLALETPAS